MSRREFTEAVKRAIRARSGGVCECYLMPADIRHMFPKACANPPRDIDHIYADTLESDEAKRAALTADEGAHLCTACHKIKTVSDQDMRGKRGKHKVRKDRPKSGWFHKGAKLQSRGFSTTHKRKLPTKSDPRGKTVRREGV